VNAFEELGRGKKIRALLNALDRNFVEQGINPYRDGLGIAAGLACWTSAEWIALAEALEIRPPSAETVDELLKEYRGRAVKALAS